LCLIFFFLFFFLKDGFFIKVNELLKFYFEL